jgi:hypothetical protein
VRFAFLAFILLLGFSRFEHESIERTPVLLLGVSIHCFGGRISVGVGQKQKREQIRLDIGLDQKAVQKAKEQNVHEVSRGFR